MEKKLKNIIDDTPEMILPIVQMAEPNKIIEIYEGDYEIGHDEKTISLYGKIQFNWFPHTGTTFLGEVRSDNNNVDNLFQEEDRLKLRIDGLDFGDCAITSITYSDLTILEGMILSEAIFGDKSIKVSKIIFSLPNFREFYGCPS